MIIEIGPFCLVVLNREIKFKYISIAINRLHLFFLNKINKTLSPSPVLVLETMVPKDFKMSFVLELVSVSFQA